jgi:hypothetical protein
MQIRPHPARSYPAHPVFSAKDSGWQSRVSWTFLYQPHQARSYGHAPVLGGRWNDLQELQDWPFVTVDSDVSRHLERYLGLFARGRLKEKTHAGK